MNWINSHIASITILIPLITSVFCLASPSLAIARNVCLIGSGACFFSALHIWYHYDASLLEIQFNETYVLLNQFGINYQVGVDGLNLLFIVLCTFLTPFIIFNLPEKQNPKGKIILALIMLSETATLSTLMALDLFFFHFCWEAAMIPIYFIIGLSGGKKRIEASAKLFILNATSSTLMLLGIIALYLEHAGKFGFYSASLADLLKIETHDFTSHNCLFLGFTIGFAAKGSVWPFHTPLVSAYSKAPIIGSIILSGVFLKVACYGFLRFAIPLFPDSVNSFALTISSLGIIGMILTALASFKQQDVKKLLGYASISHFSLGVLGCVAFDAGNLASEALLGTVYRSLSHAISFTILFSILAAIYDRCATLKFISFSKLTTKTKIQWLVILLIAMDCIGIPGTGGFVGLFLVLSPLFKQNTIIGWIALIGILLGAAYTIKIGIAILSELPSRKVEKLSEFSIKEKLLIMPLIALSLAMGVYPEFFLSKIRPTLEHLAKNYKHYQLEPENILSYRPLNNLKNAYRVETYGEK